MVVPETRMLLLGAVAMFQPVNGSREVAVYEVTPSGHDLLIRISDFLPFRCIVDAVRGSFAGDLSGSTFFWGTGWAVALFELAPWWGTSTFRKEDA